MIVLLPSGSVCVTVLPYATANGSALAAAVDKRTAARPSAMRVMRIPFLVAGIDTRGLDMVNGIAAQRPPKKETARGFLHERRLSGVIGEPQARRTPFHRGQFSGRRHCYESGLHILSTPADVRDKKIGKRRVLEFLVMRPKRRDAAGEDRRDTDAAVGLNAKRVEIGEPRKCAFEIRGRESRRRRADPGRRQR